MGRKSKKKPNYKKGAQLHALVTDLEASSNWSPISKPTRQVKSPEQRYVKNISPRNDAQAQLIDSIENHHLTLAVGPAGTGKTFVAIAKAVEALEAGKVDRIILSRPAIEAGESLGFLPGDMQEKMSPYLRPLYDALNDRLGSGRMRHYLKDGTIEIAPIGFMRGRTVNKAFIIIDEAQNCTYAQIKMLLTRLGWQSTMVLTGDPDQSDLLDGLSGLPDVVTRLKTLPDIGVIELSKKDIVRHPLVASMLTVL